MTSKLACKITHHQLVSGCCPWCEIKKDEKGLHARIWSLAALIEGGLSENDDTRRITIANLVYYDVPFWDAIEALELHYASVYFSKGTAFDIVNLGRKLPGDFMQFAIENHRAVMRRPVLAAAILGFTFLAKFSSDKAKHVHSQTLLGLIDNHPASSFHCLPEATFDPSMEAGDYMLGLELWRKHVLASPTDSLIIENARSYRRLEP